MLRFDGIQGCRLVVAGLLLVTLAVPEVEAQQQPAERLAPPVTGNVEMHPVTPEEAERSFSARTVPETDQVALPQVNTQPPVKLDIKPVLGHDLPKSDVTPYGFKRADFAIDKPESSGDAARSRKQILGSGVIVGPQPPPAKLPEKKLPKVSNP